VDGSDSPKEVLDLNPVIKPKKKNDGTFRECDFEGAAQIEKVIYWIGSHGRNKQAEERVERQVLVATQISGSGAEAKLSLIGTPFRGLLTALTSADNLKAFDLAGASVKSPEKPGALNIESICAMGDALLIGFRNPIPGGKALLVPLQNPLAVVKGDAKPDLGEPILLDLGGLGVRDMAPWRKQFLIIGGDFKDGGEPSALFLWSGDPKMKPQKLKGDLSDLNPEAIVIHETGGESRVQLLSDDGGTSFRSTWVTFSDK
jgi:hypothetical protein